MVEKFLSVFQQFSGKIAIINPDDSSVTFEEFEKCVIAIQKTLASHKIENCFLPVLAPKTSSVIAVFIACLQNNICYMPIDVNSPPSRNNLILSDIGSQYLIISKPFMQKYASLIKKVVCAVDGDLALVQTIFKNDLKNTDTAYILFTSGSTGVPRGVMISKTNMQAFLDWAVVAFASYNGRVLSIAPFHFDLSVFDIYFPLIRGGTLIIPDDAIIKAPREIGKYIKEKDINIIYSTPTVFRHFLKFGDLKSIHLQDVKLVLSAGETLRTSLTNDLFLAFPKADIFNLYGPTETNVCSFHKVRKQELEGDVPIGKVCAHLTWFLLKDEQLDTAEGELCIAGDNVFKGYWNASAVGKFFNNGTKSFYKTGDWVYQKDKLLYFSNRIDRMVKYNGYRVELTEIELTLTQHESIQWASVISHEISGRGQLIAFIQARPLSSVVNIHELKVFLATKLPAYMLPSRYVFIGEIPLSSNHKTDFQKLLRLFDEQFS